MEHGKRRGSYRTIEAERLDLGNEPALSVDGETTGLVDRRRVSVQWFSGTILTGLCGAALMGGAVFAALDGQTNYATVPPRGEVALRGAVGSASDRLAAVRKSNRLQLATEVNAHRQTFPVSITGRVGNHEVMRVRPYVRIASNLAMTLTELSANIPAFNPQKMLAQAESPDAAAAADPGAEPDAEVSFVTRELVAALPRAKIAALEAMDEVVVAVRDAALDAGRDVTASTKLAYAAEATADPYQGLQTRIAPENITLLPKTTPQTTGGNPWNERTVTLRKGDSVPSVLRDLGARPEEIRDVVATLGGRGLDGGVKEGQRLRILLGPTGDPKRFQPLRVAIAGDAGIEAIAALSDRGRYIPVDAHAFDTLAQADDGQDVDDGTGVRLYQSIYETALRNQVPRPVIEELIRVYSYDVDFQRRAQPGDSLELLFAGEDARGGDKAEVLFASLTTGGETRKYYRYQSPDDNVVDYYDETGKSAKKFLVRKPVSDGLITSPFSDGRYHPILGYTRPHTGVDWGASFGTPIFASGNGVIEKIGIESGYGKYIRVRHANGYETAYGHMSAFARNMDEGVHVRQGQVIGYVGSTGLSTGSHLHYEILINGRFVDPMKVKLPRGRVLEGPVLATFDQQRDRLDKMMSGQLSPSALGPQTASAIR